MLNEKIANVDLLHLEAGCYIPRFKGKNQTSTYNIQKQIDMRFYFHKFTSLLIIFICSLFVNIYSQLQPGPVDSTGFNFKICAISGDTKDYCMSFDKDGNITIPAGLVITTNDGKGTSFQSIQTGNVGTSYSYLYVDFTNGLNPTLFVQNSRIPSSLDSVRNNKNLYLLGSVRIGSKTAVLNCNYYKMLGITKGIWSEQEIVKLAGMKVCNIHGDTKENCISFDVEGNVVIPAGLIITTNDGKGNSFQSVQTGSAGTSYSYLYIDFTAWSNPKLYVQNSKIPSSLDSVRNNKNLYLLGNVRVGSKTAVLNCSYYKMQGKVKGIWSEQEIKDLIDTNNENIVSNSVSSIDLRNLYIKFEELSSSANR
jgi:hypothetical protein